MSTTTMMLSRKKTNIKFLIEQQELLKSAVVALSVIASSAIFTKEAIGTIASSSTTAISTAIVPQGTKTKTTSFECKKRHFESLAVVFHTITTKGT